MNLSAVTHALSRHRLWALVIVLVAVLTGLGISVLLGDRGSTALAPSDEPTLSPTPTADVSETATPASQPGSPSPNAAASPAPTVVAAPTAAPAPSLAVDTIAVTLVDDLTVRQEPSTSGAALGTLGPAGEAAFVVAGPVDADGHHWYQLASMREPDDSCIELPGLPKPPLRCYGWFGWVAGTGAGGDAWLGPRRDVCPTAPVDTADFVDLDELERLACFGASELTLQAFHPPPMELGCGLRPFHVEPSWLDQCAGTWLTLGEWRSHEDDVVGSGRLGFAVNVHPSLGNCAIWSAGSGGFGYEDRARCPLPGGHEDGGRWIEVGGHLDDPAASTCAIEIDEGSPDPAHLPTAEAVILGCRASFVVTSITPVSSP